MMQIAWRSFREDVTGAVTVDWVVLTAAIIGLGMLVLLPIGLSTDSVASKVGASIGGLNLGWDSN